MRRLPIVIWQSARAHLDDEIVKVLGAEDRDDDGGDDGGIGDSDEGYEKSTP